jgi:alanyl-tRNA synthetase
MAHEEIRAVEDLVNAMILQNEPVETHLMTPEAAIAQGALALFGEKYGEEVRVVSMGKSNTSTRTGHAYSIELCGGTHVRRTGDIGILKIVSESAVAAGVRRIEALTGETARAYLAAQDERVREAAELLKVSPDEVSSRLAAVIDERRKLERELAESRKKLALGGGAAPQGEESNIIDVGGTKVFRLRVNGLPNNDLKALADEGKAKVKSGVVAIANTAPDGKGGLVVGVTDDLTTQFNAVDLVRAGAEALGGKGGGGRPDLAQAGGPDGSRAEQALEAIAAKIAAQAGAPAASPAPDGEPKRRARRA